MQTVKPEIHAGYAVCLCLSLLLGAIFAPFGLTGRPVFARRGGAQTGGSSWGVTGDLKTSRFLHTATRLADGRVLVVGGADNNFMPTNKAEVYDPAARTWRATGDSSAARFGHSATLLANGRVLVVGGFGLSSAEIYNPATGTWSDAGSLSAARDSHTATLLANGKVLVAGGNDFMGEPVNSAELFDPAANGGQGSQGSWSVTGQMANARQAHIAARLTNGRVLVAGGGGAGLSFLSQAEVYNPATGTWSATGALNTARMLHAGTLLANGKVLVTGGLNESAALQTAEIYDPAPGTWAATGDLNTARFSHTATLLANNQALIAGGVDQSENALTSAELFNPAGNGGQGSVAAAANLNIAREEHTATLLQNGQVLAAGGAGASSVLESAELFNLMSTCPAITINPTTIPPGTVGAAYPVATFTQSGATGAVTFNQSGALPAGMTFSGATLSGTPARPGNFPITITVIDSNNCAGSRNYTLRVNLAPGSPLPDSSPSSGQKAGSVLFYNLFTSDPSSPHSQNTRLSITNTNELQPAFIHLYFVNGSDGLAADGVLCLRPNQTATFLASDLDPGTTGYLIAVVVDGATGCPISFNFLIGDEYVKFSSGHAANLGAEAFAALEGGLPACDTTARTAVLRFDGTQFNQAPSVLLLDNIADRASGNDTLLVVNRVGGDLVTSVGIIGEIAGVLYDDTENAYAFTDTASACQFKAALSNHFPRTIIRFGQVIAAGHSGWMKLWGQSGTALLGAAINFNPSERSSPNAYTQGHNLHHLRLTTAASLTIPVFPPSC